MHYLCLCGSLWQVGSCNDLSQRRLFCLMKQEFGWLVSALGSRQDLDAEIFEKADNILFTNDLQME